MSEEPKAGTFTPGPWEVEGTVYEHMGAAIRAKSGECRAIAQVWQDPNCYVDACLMALAPELLTELNAALGYMLNAKFDLESGVKKTTAIATLNGGIARVRAAIRKAEGSR